MAALEEVALHTMNHVVVQEVDMSGHRIFCEVSDPANPRPLIPCSQRSLVCNLLHYMDHPGQKETARRITREYYWPGMRRDIGEFVKTCHPCQLAKQSPTVNPGIGHFPVPDRRFEYIHIDTVGPLPESQGHRYLLSVLDRCSRWIEAFPLIRGTSEEVCQAFIQYVSRFGLCKVAVSDNGNAFIANIFNDLMQNFGITVSFTPAYQPQSNGAVERKHQDIKNALKAALVDMGNVHKDKWMKALPWVLLGLRVKYQPNLEASAAQMVLGMTPRIPGTMCGVPGPPLNSTQLRALLDQLYIMGDRKPVQTTSIEEKREINTNEATHVYVKVDNPLSLSPKFEGPYAIKSRPSRSQVEVKVGKFSNGVDRTLTFHWSSCKVAHMREGANARSRPTLGRPPTSPQTRGSPPGTSLIKNATTPVNNANPNEKDATTADPDPPKEESKQDGGQTRTGRQIRITRNPNPRYVDGYSRSQ